MRNKRYNGRQEVFHKDQDYGDRIDLRTVWVIELTFFLGIAKILYSKEIKEKYIADYQS